MKNFLLVLIGFICYVQVFSQEKQFSDQEKEIIKPIDLLFNGMRKGDSSMVRSAFHSEATLSTTFTDPKGNARFEKEKVDDFVKAVGTVHKEIWDERILNYNILISDNLAQVWTEYEFYVDDKFSHCGANAFLLFKDQQGWKIINITDTRRRENCKK